MNSTEFCQLLKAQGYDFFTGVPCSLLKGIIAEFENDGSIPYLPAVREDSALGVAAGAYLAGKQPVVLMQNSGIGTGLNALTSLHLIYRLPCLIIISWRGHGPDAPEHWIMGKKTIPLLETIDVPALVPDEENVIEIIMEATQLMSETGQPVAVILKKGIIS